MRREASVDGLFYPRDKDALRRQLQEFLKGADGSVEAKVVIAPHAGYIYSGGIAGQAYRQISIPDTVVVMSPNHTGLGTRASIMSSGEWMTPLGTVKIDETLSELLLKRIDLLMDDAAAHIKEHAIEVHLPFLQYLNPSVRLVPITLWHLGLDECRILGEGLKEVITEYKERVLVVASTDMSHYENHEIAQKKDRLAIEKILNIDPEGLYNVVTKNSISMCGVIPTTVALYYARATGAKDAWMCAYGTSGEKSGDFNSVVGYVSVIID